MFFVLCEIPVIYFLATVLFLAIHHYEHDGPLATVFKCLVLAVGGVAILNKLQPLLYRIRLTSGFQNGLRQFFNEERNSVGDRKSVV